MKKVLSLFSCILFSWMQAQLGYWQNDTTTKDQSVYAIKNITLYQDYKTVIPDAVLVIQNGKVLESGKVAIPKNAVVIDGKGKFVYPSFIDLYTNIGVEKSEAKQADSRSIYLPNTASAAAYNDAVKAYSRAVDQFTNQGKDYEEYLNQGFGTVLSFNQDGIVRGSAVLYNLGNGKPAEKIIKEDAALMLSFDKGSSRQSYPTSLAGSIALLRQFYLDADWYEKGGNAVEKNLNFQHFGRIQRYGFPSFFLRNVSVFNQFTCFLIQSSRHFGIIRIDGGIDSRF